MNFDKESISEKNCGLDILILLYLFSSLSPFLWETARNRLKYCLKGPLNPKQPTISEKKKNADGGGGGEGGGGGNTETKTVCQTVKR